MRTLSLDFEPRKEEIFKDAGYKPHRGQLLVHSSRARFRVLACGRRWGKSLCAAMEGLAASLIPGSRGWVVAPTYELAEKVFRELFTVFSVNKQFRDLVESKSISRQNMHIRLVYGSEIHGKSADNPDSLLGEGLDWLVVDEAARVKEEVWKHYLRPTLTDRQGWALFISTPAGRNWFYEMFIMGQDREQREYESWRFPSEANPYLSKLEIEQARRTLPDRAFRQEYLAEFISDAGGVFRNVRGCIQGSFEDPQSQKSYTMGVDLAKYQDFTVICVLDDSGHLVYFDRFAKVDWNLQKQRILLAAKKYNARVIVDSTGVGDPIYEDLVRMGLNVQGYTITGASKKALIDNLVLRIEQRQITFPEIPELINELEIYEYELTRAGNLRFNAPSGYHDDCVIALALAALGLRKTYPAKLPIFGGRRH